VTRLWASRAGVSSRSKILSTWRFNGRPTYRCLSKLGAMARTWSSILIYRN